MHLSPEELAAWIAIIVAVSSGGSTLLNRWARRRAASGSVGTSEASVLWQQTQDIRTMLLAEKTRAEDQRDRLIENYTNQVLPALAETKEAILHLAATTQELTKVKTETREAVLHMAATTQHLVQATDEIRVLLKGGGSVATRALAAAEQPPDS